MMANSKQQDHPHTDRMIKVGVSVMTAGVTWWAEFVSTWVSIVYPVGRGGR